MYPFTLKRVHMFILKCVYVIHRSELQHVQIVVKFTLYMLTHYMHVYFFFHEINVNNGEAFLGVAVYTLT